MTLQLVDLSSNNHPDDAPIDWPAVAASGMVQAVIVKATEGGQVIDGQLVGYANPWALRDLQGARAVGIPGICYHFARFGVEADELRWFLLNAGAGLARALDFETSTATAWIEAFMAGLRAPALGYGSVGTYPNLDARIRRWIAAWGRSEPPPDCDLWQWTSSGWVPGIPGKVDLNLWVGDLADFEALFGELVTPDRSLLLTGGPPL